MNLWKNLDKITTFLKNSPTKVLMLDFDGTLAPIVESPKKAKLSKEFKNLLVKLSKKRGFYLAVISGRSLSDLKKKVNLKNIIYAGNHGLEGEIFQQKYVFPIPNKTLAALKNIRGQLDKIAGRFKGVFIEDKGLALSFHYRLVSKQQASPVKLLFKKIMRPYLKIGLISIVAGKMVFDIRPKVNWNKGSFAKLVIDKIRSHSKAIPLVIFIGDDTSDEDVFQMFERGISIRVGLRSHSKAKYRLKTTKDVFKFLKYIYLATQVNIVWRGLVRDASGRWQKYHRDGIKYFKHGTQPKPDLTNEEQFDLLESSVAHEKAFVEGLQNRSFENIIDWLIKLHKIQAYKGRKGKILTARRVSRGEHSQVVKNAIMPLARKYADPYLNHGIQILYLPNISPEALPRDQWRNSNRVIHYYPDPKFFNQYLQIMKKTLGEFMENINNTDKYKLLLLIARYYQYAINMHMFVHVNQTLFCNQLNAMLKLINLNPIEHGVLDFAATRLQPKNFAEYFVDEVKTNVKF